MLHLHATFHQHNSHIAFTCILQHQAVSSLPMHKPTVPDLPINNLPGYIQKFACYRYIIIITTNPMLHSHATSHYWYINIHSHGLHAVTHLLGPHAVPNHHSPWLCLGPCTGPSSFTYMDTWMSFNPQSQTQCTTVPNKFFYSEQGLIKTQYNAWIPIVKASYIINDNHTVPNPHVTLKYSNARLNFA